jgi:hypothetical protein
MNFVEKLTIAFIVFLPFSTRILFCTTHNHQQTHNTQQRQSQLHNYSFHTMADEQHDAHHENMFRMKRMRAPGQDKTCELSFVMQNENGPCPLLAICMTMLDTATQPTLPNNNNNNSDATEYLTAILQLLLVR